MSFYPNGPVICPQSYLCLWGGGQLKTMFKANRKKTAISQAEKNLKAGYDINDMLLFSSSF